MPIDYMSRCVNYWARLTQMPTYRYPKQCYNMLGNLEELRGRLTSDNFCFTQGLFTLRMLMEWAV